MSKESETIIHMDIGETKGRFFTDPMDGHVAEMTFSIAGESLMIIDHTEVPQALSGQGIGVSLVEHGVNYARKVGRKVVPLCPYAAHQFRKHADWHDVLDK